MGSGSSATPAKTNEVEVIDTSSTTPKVASKYKVPKFTVPGSENTEESAEEKHHVCDGCGEMRKTTKLGVNNSEWLCAACQLEGNLQRKKPPKYRVKDLDPEDGPQPLRNTENAPEARGGRRRRTDLRGKFNTGPAELNIGSDEEQAEVAPRARRGGKERALESAGGSESPEAKKRVRGSGTFNVGPVVAERADYRSSNGLKALKEQMGVPRNSIYLSEMEGLASETTQHKKPNVVTLVNAGKLLPGGFSVGDRVSSLISRVRGGLLVLEIGHEGAIVSARTGGEASCGDTQYLVQFDKAFDWLLPQTQICPVSTLSTKKASGLPRFTWGTRVRSLVTFLNPAGSQRGLWLGHSGTVVGPGLIQGKLAVRFDDGAGEWSVWPSVLCEADSYNTIAQEKLAGGYSRGDRVVVKRAATGSRSGPVKEAHTLSGGEEGTVVGPGHAGGRLLVHLDSDEKVWSMAAEQLVSA